MGVGLRLAVAMGAARRLSQICALTTIAPRSLICSLIYSFICSFSPIDIQVLELKVKWEILESVLASSSADGKVAWRAFLQQYNAEYDPKAHLGEGKDAKVDDDEGGRG